MKYILATKMIKKQKVKNIKIKQDIIKILHLKN